MKTLIFSSFVQVITLQASSPFDASHLQTGQFVYRDIKDGQQVATFTLTVNKQSDGNYLFTGEAEGFFQHWEAVATPDFIPKSSELEMQRSTGQHYQMKLHYINGEVNGTIWESDAASHSKVTDPTVRQTRSTHALTPAHTIDQRIDWAAMLSATINPGAKLSFFVYDPSTGLTPVTGQAVGLKTMTVPAGKYETMRLQYSMQKKSGMESYEIQITQITPRMMIREVFPDGTVTELIKATPTSR